MVEFALVFLLLFTLITLVVQAGIFFSGWLAVTNGAREGARFGAPCLNRVVPGRPDLTCDEADVEARVRDRMAGFLDPTVPPDVTVAVDPAGDFVTVTVTATVSSVGPIPLSLPIYGVSKMRLEVRP